MPELCLSILLDQNVPIAVAGWLRVERPGWIVWHTNELGFAGRDDAFLYHWAQEQSAIVITYDEDFADARSYPLGKHHGIIRLRIWPTTVEGTIAAIARLLAQLPAADWPGSLVIIGNQTIRVRRVP